MWLSINVWVTTILATQKSQASAGVTAKQREQVRLYDLAQLAVAWIIRMIVSELVKRTMT